MVNGISISTPSIIVTRVMHGPGSIFLFLVEVIRYVRNKRRRLILIIYWSGRQFVNHRSLFFGIKHMVLQRRDIIKRILTRKPVHSLECITDVLTIYQCNIA